MITAVIFDFDGVIADSMPHHFEAEKMTLKKFGVNVHTSELHYGMGSKIEEKFEKILSDHNNEEDLAKIIKEHLVSGHDHVKKNTTAGDGAVALINKLKEKVKIGVVSGSPKQIVYYMLDKFGITDSFECIITGDDVKVGKPNPEGFLKCAQMLNANPKECVVIEDAPSGIEAARRAGMKAVGLWTNHGRN